MKSYLSIILFIVFTFVSCELALSQTTSAGKLRVSDERLVLETKEFNPESAVAKDLEPKKPRPMLPRYFSRVVSLEQRAEIRSVQEQYLPLIKMLEARIEALKEEMNENVHAVLSAEQLKEVDKSNAEARKARQAASAARSSRPIQPQATEKKD